MNVLSTQFQNEQSRWDLARLQREMGLLQQQVATGSKASDLKALAGDAAELVGVRTLMAQNEAKVASAKEMVVRLEVQDNALGRAAEAGRSLQQAVLEAISTNDGRQLSAALDMAFIGVRSGLNATNAGKAVFGGERSDVAPIRINATSDLTSPTYPTPSDWFETSERDQLADLGDAAPYIIAERGEALGTDILVAMRDLRAQIDAAGGVIGAPLSAAQRAALGTIATQADAGARRLEVAQARNGVLLARAEDSQRRLEKQDLLLQKTAGAMQDANLPEVAMRLQQVQVQYQASAQVYTQLKDMTLLNFLR